MDEHDFTLGVDLACSASHVATLADAAGRLVWSNHRFRTAIVELERLWAKVPGGARLQLVMEPTRNAWVPLAAWFRARGVTVILVPPEQSADLRRYYQKHTKNDRLDSVLLARLPLLHPDGLNVCQDLGPADPLRRTVRRRTKLVRQRITSLNRLTALLELLGPGYNDAFSGGPATKTAQAVLSRYADPRKLLRTPARRLVQVVAEASRGQHGPSLVNQLRGAATEAMALYGTAGVDFAELAADIEPRCGRSRLSRQRSTNSTPGFSVSTLTPTLTRSCRPRPASVQCWPQRFTACSATRTASPTLAPLEPSPGWCPTPTSPASARHRPGPPKQVTQGCGPPYSWPPTWPGRPTPHWPPSTVGSSWSASCTTILRSATSRRFSPPVSWLVFAPAPPIRSADSTDKPSPPPKAEPSAKDSGYTPTNGPARHAASGKRARRNQRSLSASPPDPPKQP